MSTIFKNKHFYTELKKYERQFLSFFYIHYTLIAQKVRTTTFDGIQRETTTRDRKYQDISVRIEKNIGLFKKLNKYKIYYCV